MKSIYAITPSDVEFKRLIKEVERMLDFGIKVFQYREKNLSENLIMANAEKLLEMIKKNEGKLIINDNPKIAVDYNVRFTCSIFTSVCLVTSQPDFA